MHSYLCAPSPTTGLADPDLLAACRISGEALATLRPIWRKKLRRDDSDIHSPDHRQFYGGAPSSFNWRGPLLWGLSPLKEQRGVLSLRRDRRDKLRPFGGVLVQDRLG